MKKTYMAPKMEQEIMKEVLPLCNSGVKGGGIPGAPGFGGKDLGGIHDPAANERFDFEEELGLNGLLW